MKTIRFITGIINVLLIGAVIIIGVLALYWGLRVSIHVFGQGI